MRIKMGTFVPKMGTIVHLDEIPGDYRTAIAMALHVELGSTHRVIKSAMRWTGASERTVKYWFQGERGPSGEHLVSLRATFRGSSDRAPGIGRQGGIGGWHGIAHWSAVLPDCEG